MVDLRAVIPKDRPTRLLAGATLINTFGNGLFFTVSVVYFTRIVGLSAHQLGIGLAAAGVAGILAGIPAGHLADRLGAREVMIALTLVSAAWMAAFALVSGFAGFVVVGCLYAFFDRGAGAVRQALIAAVAPGDGRVRTRAYLRSVTNVGIGAGSLVAAAALVLDVKAGYVALILVNAATFLGAVALLARLPHQPPVPREAGAPVLPVLRDRPYVAFCLLYAVATTQFAILEVAVPLWVVQETSAPTWVIAAVFFLNTAVVAIFQVSASRGTEEVEPAALALRTSGWLVLAACVVFALSAGPGPVVAVAPAPGRCVDPRARRDAAVGRWVGRRLRPRPGRVAGAVPGSLQHEHGRLARDRSAADDGAAHRVRARRLGRPRADRRSRCRWRRSPSPVGDCAPGRWQSERDAFHPTAR